MPQISGKILLVYTKQEFVLGRHCIIYHCLQNPRNILLFTLLNNPKYQNRHPWYRLIIPQIGFKFAHVQSIVTIVIIICTRTFNIYRQQTRCSKYLTLTAISQVDSDNFLRLVIVVPCSKGDYVFNICS
jgi:hypothetical protein